MVPRPRPLAAGRATSTKLRSGVRLPPAGLVLEQARIGGRPSRRSGATPALVRCAHGPLGPRPRPYGPEPLTYALGLLLGAAVVLAVACSGSRGGDHVPEGLHGDPVPEGLHGDPVEVGVAGVSADASPEAESDPADAGDAPPDDSPYDRPDPEGSGAAPDTNGGTDGSGDAVAEGDGPTEAGGDAGESGVAGSGAGESGVTENDAGESGVAEGGAGESGVAEGGAGGSGVAGGGAGENGAGENGVAAGGAGDGEAGKGGDEVVTTPENSGTIGIAAPESILDRPRAPLTGELIGDSTLAKRRALAVKVGNSDQRSRPQAGLAAADIVYETLIEGGESRLTAVFHSEIPGRVGPVRSARTSDFNLLADLSRPYLASSGANVTVLSETRRADRAGTIVDIGGMRTFVPYSRDPDRRPPHNLYFHSESLTNSDGSALRGGPLEAPVVPLLDYGSPNPAGIAGAKGVTVTYHRPTGNVVSHIWDETAGGWVRIQEGDLMMTETGSGLREVAPVNVAVVWMTHRYAPADPESPLTQSYGTGDALVLTAGAVHEAVWERTADRAGFRFVDTAGNPLSFSPGSTWLLIANSSRRFPVTGVEVLAAGDGARLLADAREAAEAAGVP